MFSSSITVYRKVRKNRTVNNTIMVVKNVVKLVFTINIYSSTSKNVKKDKSRGVNIKPRYSAGIKK